MPETIGKVWRWEIHSCSCEYKLNTIDTFLAFDIIRMMSQPEADSEPSSVSNRNTVVAAAAVVTFVVVVVAADDCLRSWCASARRAGAAGDPCSSAR